MEYDFKNLAFREIIDEKLEEIISPLSQKIVVPKKKVFLTEGDDLSLLYYIRSGDVSLYMTDNNGAEKTLYCLTRGWFFGEIVYMLGLTRTSLHFKTSGETVLYGLDKHSAARLMESSVNFRDALMKCTCYKTIALRYEIANFTYCSSKTRLLKSLYRDVDASRPADGQWYCLSEKRTHYELGVDIGANRVTVSRLISELCCEGRLRTVNNQIQFSRKLYEIMSAEIVDLESFLKIKDPYFEDRPVSAER